MTFALSEEQLAKFKKWKDELGPGGYDSFGTRFAFTFVPSGIGDSVTVKDLATGKELDLTDYDY